MDSIDDIKKLTAKLEELSVREDKPDVKTDQQNTSSTCSKVAKGEVVEDEVKESNKKPRRSLMRKVPYDSPYGTINSWIINEWSFSRSSEKLPIYARGLFTLNDQIIIRGYNKFFNMNENEDTEEKTIRAKTKGPYSVSVKENGCIIFISGLENGDIIVTSKTAVKWRSGRFTNHAVAGEEALRKQLSESEINDLAKYLYQEKLTAVCELCDDSFEEHVLPYTREEAGLYLHGLNYNTIEFKGKSLEEIDEFAQKWKFKRVEYFKYDDLDELLSFFKEQSKTGTYQNKPVEGFVVRCTREGKQYLFKYKFKEPYLFYRQLRELTNLHVNQNLSVEDIKLSMAQPDYISVKYLDFIDQYFKNPHRVKKWKEGHGIIETRETFFKESGINPIEVMNIDKTNDDNNNSSPATKADKYIVVSVATPGSGKTTTFKTVFELFPQWSHQQNDDYQNGRAMIPNCLKDLALGADCVLLDKNNHQFKERQLIFDTIDEYGKVFFKDNVNVHTICCNFLTDKSEMKRINLERIVKRGDNHQSIKASEDPILAEKIIQGFVDRSQAINVQRKPDSRFETVVNMENTNDEYCSLNNAKKLVGVLHDKYPELVPVIPSDEDFLKAFEKAKSYVPVFTKKFKVKKEKKEKTNKSTDENKPKKKQAKGWASYYGVQISDAQNLIDIVEKVASTGAKFEPSVWKDMRNNKTCQKEFHVTLAHVSDKKSGDDSRKEIWDFYVSKLSEAQYNEEKNKPNNQPESSVEKVPQLMNLEYTYDVRLDELVVAKNYLICFKVTVLKCYDSEGKECEVKTTIPISHITVGTYTKDIKPFESNLILKAIANQQEQYRTTEDGKSVSVLPIEPPIILQRQPLMAHK